MDTQKQATRATLKPPAWYRWRKFFIVANIVLGFGLLWVSIEGMIVGAPTAALNFILFPLLVLNVMQLHENAKQYERIHASRVALEPSDAIGGVSVSGEKKEKEVSGEEEKDGVNYWRNQWNLQTAERDALQRENAELKEQIEHDQGVHSVTLNNREELRANLESLQAQLDEMQAALRLTLESLGDVENTPRRLAAVLNGNNALAASASTSSTKEKRRKDDMSEEASNASGDALIRDLLEFLTQLSVHGEIKWKFDEQQAEPINKFWTQYVLHWIAFLKAADSPKAVREFAKQVTKEEVVLIAAGINYTFRDDEEDFVECRIKTAITRVLLSANLVPTRAIENAETEKWTRLVHACGRISVETNGVVGKFVAQVEPKKASAICKAVYDIISQTSCASRPIVATNQK